MLEVLIWIALFPIAFFAFCAAQAIVVGIVGSIVESFVGMFKSIVGVFK